MVPYTTVPFLSSICTFSFDSFIKNLQRAAGAAAFTGQQPEQRERRAAKAARRSAIVTRAGLPALADLTSFTIVPQLCCAAFKTSCPPPRWLATSGV
jgi:hypothetical protein